jgi:hypothetical protein
MTYQCFLPPQSNEGGPTRGVARGQGAPPGAVEVAFLRFRRHHRPERMVVHHTGYARPHALLRRPRTLGGSAFGPGDADAASGLASSGGFSPDQPWVCCTNRCTRRGSRNDGGGSRCGFWACTMLFRRTRQAIVFSLCSGSCTPSPQFTARVAAARHRPRQRSAAGRWASAIICNMVGL